jgi:hypothetical protein
VAAKGEYSVEDAIRSAVNKGKASVETANGDLVEIIDIKENSKLGTLTLLIHRASPNAADPNYR